MQLGKIQLGEMQLFQYFNLLMVRILNVEILKKKKKNIYIYIYSVLCFISKFKSLPPPYILGHIAFLTCIILEINLFKRLFE